jgi:hypothetical protein
MKEVRSNIIDSMVKGYLRKDLREVLPRVPGFETGGMSHLYVTI